mgnify:CR=1 FL=1
MPSTSPAYRPLPREGRYIHSTGASASGGVVINSLDPADPLYREDLVKSLYAVGSVF